MDSLGVVESRSIAAGVMIADEMIKGAQVELVRAGTICSGRYLIHVSGDREAVGTAVHLAKASGCKLVGSFVISNVAPALIEALGRSVGVCAGDALAVVECQTASSGIAAADCAVKRAAVRLARLVTGQGINGKSYFVVSGDLASVKEAVDAAAAASGSRLVETVVIPSPTPAVVESLTTLVRE